MLPDMYFIYSLSCEDSIFYIGKTKNLAQRYIGHLSCDGSTNVGRHISKLMAEGKKIVIKYIDYLPDRKAWEREMQLISDLTRGGQILFNSVFTWHPCWDHDKVPNNLSKKQMIIFLKYQQQVKEYNHAFNNNMEGWEE